MTEGVLSDIVSVSVLTQINVYHEANPLTPGSSIKDSSSSTGASLNTMLEETRPTYGGTQETMEITLDELHVMSPEQLETYGRLQGWKVRTWSAPTLTVGLHTNWRLDSP